ncbi:efflux RND transporter periplasmic adaptor subunit [Vulcaniibacterium gelatinicum]|uniref:efflux RND transporter periplasmic adaptor subunit n=1 Tax=Vulcaniibacterium gelatinicum TaxID=2598725 RepID=UPI0011CC85B4|nr:efflux RND transporter periplasmic adaptor subunit [Vulcaniibacterium gelatinicum]
MKHFGAGTGMVLLALALAACGNSQSPPERPRPVLVVQPGAAGEAAVTAYPGEVRAREESPLAFRVGGQLVRRHVDVGDAVRRGELLAELDPDDLRLQAQAAQARLAAAEAQLARTAADRARFAALAQQQLVSRSALDAQEAAHAAAAGEVRAARAALEVARNQVAYAQLRAPRDGVIAQRHAEAGQTVAPGQPVFTLAGSGGREVAIALPEARIRSFRVGRPVTVVPWSAPQLRLPGTLREIAPSADPAARTYAARVALPDAAAKAVDLGQSVRVFVADPADAPRMRLPLSALQRGAGGATAVWVVTPDGHVRLQPVQVGPFGADGVPVLGGLAPDAWVVAAGGHLLREGQRVQPVDRDNRPVAAAGPRARAE